MARKKADVLSRLSRSHLEGIGRVAATWSLLERDILLALSEISGITFFSTLVLASPSAFAGWMDMLLLLGKKHQLRELQVLVKLFLKLLRLRNNLVHLAWSAPESRGIGLINSRMMPKNITPLDKVKGLGIPKRGRDVIVEVEWSPKQMRQVASLIEASRKSLNSLVYRRQPTSPQEHVADALLSQTNLLHIQNMLDTLPDPFQKLSKKKRIP